MIFWIASYPKSGNTWIRTVISSYFYSKDGIYDEKLIKKIDQFPTRKYFNDFDYNKEMAGDTAKFWLKAQERINIDNKLKFFKTHNVFGKVNGHDFTNSENSIGGIYVVRDPRNVITSIKNHYGLDDDKAIKWMTNKNNYIYDVEKVRDAGYGDFQFISSWDVNYTSWKVQRKVPIMFVKYEDLVDQTYSVFFKIIEFINKTTHNSEKINKSKLKNSLNSTNFDKLKQMEKKRGFSEAVTSLTTNEKITFFNLGPKNDWKKLLNEDLKTKLSEVFKKNLAELYYS
tara:strand:+ start:189 stop:1043 length:855 start_codon:yes stop_codon:yes gene_type:complete